MMIGAVTKNAKYLVPQRTASALLNTPAPTGRPPPACAAAGTHVVVGAGRLQHVKHARVLVQCTCTGVHAHEQRVRARGAGGSGPMASSSSWRIAIGRHVRRRHSQL